MIIFYQHAHPPFDFNLLLSCSSLRVLDSLPSLFGAFPSYLSLSRSRAFLALDPSSAFFYIYYYRINAFYANSVNALVTLLLSRADVSITGISAPISFINLCAYSMET